jgi:hypothetical protein
LRTAETHHRVFRITDGVDDDWASWYAQWLLRLDKEHTEGRVDQRWEDYYADELVRHFSTG